METGYLNDLLSLFFPCKCAACNSVLIRQEKYLCNGCLCNLPKTYYHLDKNNPMAQLFWGRVDTKTVAALFYFEKGSKCRKLLHQIKYKGKRELAEYLGFIYGREILFAAKFLDADLVVPVPLHETKMKVRGYNQSDWIARGIAMGIKKEFDNTTLIRVRATETQTKKTRIERWENVENTFAVTNPEYLENKHVILVDDVVTTGATLEACSEALKKIDGISISMLALAIA